MKAGDLVKADSWVKGGATGIVLSIQGTKYCVGAYVLMNGSVELISIENLKVIHEGR